MSKETANAWRIANLKKCAAAQRKWAAANSEKIKEKNRKRYLANRDNRLEKRKIYVERNKEAIRAWQKTYRSSPKGKIIRLNSNHKRRALKNSGENLATVPEVKELLSGATNCKYCFIRFDESTRPTLDHVIPLSKGGSHSMTNLVAACGRCNSGKKDKLEYPARAA